VAEQFGVGFKVEGLEAVKGGFATVETAARKAGETVTRVGQQTATTANQVSTGFGGARQVVANFGSALSGTAAIAALFAKQNEDLKRQLEVASLAMSGAGTAARGLAAGLRLVTSVVGAKIAVLGALVGAVVYLVRNWEAATAFLRTLWTNFAAFLGRVWEALALSARGIGEILRGAFTADVGTIRAGWDQLRTGLADLGRIAVDVGQQAFDKLKQGWKLAVDFFGGPQTKQALKDATDFLGHLKGLSIEAQQAWINMAARWEAAAKSLLGALGTVRAAIVEDLTAITAALDRALAMQATRWAQVGTAIDEMLARAADAARKGDTAFLELNRAALLRIMSPERLEMLLEQAQEVLAPGWRQIHDVIAEQTRAGWDQVLGLLQQRFRASAEDAIATAERIAEANRQAAIDYLNAWLETLFAQGRATEAIVSQINEAISRIALAPKILTPMEQALQNLRTSFQQSFSQLFTDILTNAQSFGEALLGFFRSVVNAIVSLFAQRVATKIFNFLAPVFGLASGGIVTGGLTPILAAQAGAVVSRPTLAMIGEGRQAEAVVPLPDNRSIPVKFVGDRQATRPVEVVITNYVVFDRAQIPAPTPEQIQTVVVADITKGGPIGQTIRRTVR
jgi:hypothetical protein